MTNTHTNIPPAGWGECRGRPTWTMHGPSWGVTPPRRDGFEPYFIARYGTEYTTWIYRPVVDIIVVHVLVVES